jgi:ABC-2 type transport system ATP-binding protein
MQQRVGLAQALLNDPELVFLDEPTSGLDPVGRREVRDIIRELRAGGVAVFLNSHFLSEVEVTCDRVAIVKRGRVVRAGTLDELTRGSLEVEIRARGLTDGLLAGLAAWGQVHSPPHELAPTDGVARLMLTVSSEDVLPAVAEHLIHGGARVYALAPQRLSLEDIFMRVMAEETLPDDPGRPAG